MARAWGPRPSSRAPPSPPSRPPPLSPPPPPSPPPLAAGAARLRLTLALGAAAVPASFGVALAAELTDVLELGDAGRISEVPRPLISP